MWQGNYCGYRNIYLRILIGGSEFREGLVMGYEIIYLETERDVKTKIHSKSQADDHIRRLLKVKQKPSFEYQSQVRKTS